MHAVEFFMALIAWAIFAAGIYLMIGFAFAFLMAAIQSYHERQAGWPRHRNLKTEIGHWVHDLFRWMFMWPAYIVAMFKR